MQILQTHDGFLWGNVTDKAKEIFNSGLFELYVVYYDGVDYLIEDFDELNEILGTGQGIYIELNHLKNIKQLN
jgi:hypothetical protein